MTRAPSADPPVPASSGTTPAAESPASRGAPARPVREPVNHPAMDRASDTPQEKPASEGDGERVAASSAPPAPGEVWPRALQLAGPRLRAMLETMTVQQATPKLLRLGVPASRAAMARDHLADIVRLVQETGARAMSIQFVDLKSEEGAPASSAPAESGTGHPASSREEAEQDPLVQQAARIFGAKVTHIHPKRR